VCGKLKGRAGGKQEGKKRGKAFPRGGAREGNKGGPGLRRTYVDKTVDVLRAVGLAGPGKRLRYTGDNSSKAPKKRHMSCENQKPWGGDHKKGRGMGPPPAAGQGKPSPGKVSYRRSTDGEGKSNQKVRNKKPHVVRRDGVWNESIVGHEFEKKPMIEEKKKNNKQD